MAHDDGHHGGAKAPEGLVEENGGGIMDEVFENRLARPQDQSEFQGDPLIGQGVEKGQQEFHNAGGQGGDRRAGDAQGGSAEAAEDQAVVQKGVEKHGGGKDQHTHERIFRGALGTYIYGADGVENIADAHDLQIRGAQDHQRFVVGDKAHHTLREEKHHQRYRTCQEESCVYGNAHAAVDGVGISLAPVLAAQDGQAADEAKDDDLEQKDRGVGRGDGGKLRLAQEAYHEGIHEA